VRACARPSRALLTVAADPAALAVAGPARPVPALSQQCVVGQGLSEHLGELRDGVVGCGHKVVRRWSLGGAEVVSRWSVGGEEVVRRWSVGGEEVGRCVCVCVIKECPTFAAFWNRRSASMSSELEYATSAAWFQYSIALSVQCFSESSCAAHACVRKCGEGGGVTNRLNAGDAWRVQNSGSAKPTRL
jgi:hypothetical protein